MTKKHIGFSILIIMLMSCITVSAERYSYDGDEFVSLSAVCADLGIKESYGENEITLGDTKLYLNKYYAVKGGEKIRLPRPVQCIDGDIKISGTAINKLFGICYEYSITDFCYKKSDKSISELKSLPAARGGIKERERFAEEKLTQLCYLDFEDTIGNFTVYDGTWSVTQSSLGKTLYRNEEKRSIIKYNGTDLNNYIVNVKAKGNNVGVIGRAKDDKNYYEIAYMNGIIYLNKYSGGVRTPLATHPLIWNEEKMIDIKVKFDVTEISVYVSDELRIRYNDTTSPLLSGTGGIVGAGETYFDDFRCFGFQ